MKLITDNDLKSGDRLPTERELSQMLNISRTSIREALKDLEFNYVVRIRHGSGVYVDTLDDTILNWYKKNPDEKEVLTLIKHTVELRRLLETYGFQQAAKVMTRGQIQDLYEQEERDCQEMRARNEEEGVPSLDFEQMIIGFQPNPILTNMHKRLNSFWRTYFDVIDAVALSLDVRHKDHLVIIGAIEKNDPGKIAGAVNAHLKKVADSIDLILSGQ